jgi:hypothetical protein
MLRLARENRRCGYLRIFGACRKLGIAVLAISVRSILRTHRLGAVPRGGGPSWAEFLRGRAVGTIACDFLAVETIGLTRLYVLFVNELEHRPVHLAGIMPGLGPGAQRPILTRTWRTTTRPAHTEA